MIDELAQQPARDVDGRRRALHARVVDEPLDVAPIRLDACAATCPARASGSRRTDRGEIGEPRPHPASRGSRLERTRSWPRRCRRCLRRGRSSPCPRSSFPSRSRRRRSRRAPRTGDARISSRCDDTRGFSATIATSTCCTRQPSAAMRATAARSISIESLPLFAGSRSENISPMSPAAAAPRMASVIAWATASPSECPSRCTSLGMGTPPRMSGPGGAKRCESYPMPTREAVKRTRSLDVTRRPFPLVRCSAPVPTSPARIEIVLSTTRDLEAGVGDQALDLVGRRAVRGVRGRDDVLLDHQRSEVVAAEAQRRLADLHAHRHPARLQIRHVVEHDARDRDGAQILDRVGLLHVRHRRRVLRLERPADERREAVRPRLHFAHALEMLDALGERLADAVHHRDGGLHALLVRDLHDLEPAIGAGLLLGDQIAHALHENLAAAAGNRVESRLHQLANDVARVHAERLREEVDFARAEAVNVDRVVLLDVARADRDTTRTGCRDCARPASGSARRRAPWSSSILAPICSYDSVQPSLCLGRR